MAAVVPVNVNQAHLVLTSVIVAWQLSHFDPWTAWVLLVLFALYDLFAVLTPCGPLRALVNLMQRDDAPAMPGLLYEASLANAEPSSTNRSLQQRSQSQQNRVRSNRNDNNNNNNHVGTNESDEPTNADTSTAALVTSIQNETASTTMYVATVDDNVNPVLPTSDEPTTYVSYDVDTGEGMSGVLPHAETGYIPLALAKLYKLPLRYDPQPPWITNAPPVSRNDTTAAVSSSAAAPGESSLSSPSSPANNIVTYTQIELQQLVEVVFPSTGGKIVPTLSLDSPVTALYRRTQNTDEVRYTVIDHRGLVKRVLFVNHEGRIFQDLLEENVELDRKERTSIKLGLGDFIFYSILVSKAALYSYTTFVICTLLYYQDWG
jgi:Presenilin